MRTDSLWSHTYRGDTGFYYQSNFYRFDNYMYDLHQTADSGFIIVGSDDPYGPDVWLVKLNKNGCLVPGCLNDTGTGEITYEPEIFVLYPNPVHDVLQLGNGAQQFIRSITATDVLGRKIFSSQPNTNEAKLVLDVHDLSAGIYLLQIETDKKLQTIKWVKE